MKFEDWLTLSFLLGPKLGFRALAAYICGGALIGIGVLAGLYLLEY